MIECSLSPISIRERYPFYLKTLTLIHPRLTLAQETIIENPIIETVEEEDDIDPLTNCKSCNHLVPTTMLCLYCGAPILFKEPNKA